MQLVMLIFFVGMMMSSLVKLICNRSREILPSLSVKSPTLHRSRGDQPVRFHGGSATVSEVGCGSARLACVSSLSPFILLSADPERLSLNGHQLELGVDDSEKGARKIQQRILRLFFFFFFPSFSLLTAREDRWEYKKRVKDTFPPPQPAAAGG